MVGEGLAPPVLPESRLRRARSASNNKDASVFIHYITRTFEKIALFF